MLDKNYNFEQSEKEIFKKWQDKKAFACNPESEKEGFSIVIPPPNVTGNLHLGHALDNAIQDTVCRYKRMKGFDVLWQPGTDHAGIATQVMVEKMLAKDGVSRYDLGREKFVEAVWDWKAEYGGKIVNQLHRLGASCDWDRERFTMDEGLSKAVRKVFVTLYKDGLIYRDKRLVNWDANLQTAISDLEVQQKEVVGKMWHLKYPVENQPDRFIVVATTRPETMFGDTAVAVSPEDERYKDLIGKNVILPLANRPIPVIADEYADPEKGTGAVKITPAHDFNDFEVGKRHNLPMINILDNNSRLNENVPEKYRNLSTEEARVLVLADLKEIELFDKETENPMVIPYGERSGVVVEPWLTDQWFVNAAELAKDAIKVVKDGDIEFVPKSWENTYFEWMNNIQPWCISRQLWWGHQIPVWYGCDGTVFCEESEEEAYAKAKEYYGEDSVVLTRDEDVLDTWFSSGLWAFSTMGWPDDTIELNKYYPTSLLVTGFDIIFFWVARMIMISMYFMKKVPFKKIHLHGLVRDEKGQKMSKSKGNGIDPLEMCEKYGADSLRFALLSQSGHGRDVLMSDGRVETARNFVTKIWNSVCFAQMNNAIFDKEVTSEMVSLPVNKWIIAKLDEASDVVAKNIENCTFNEASNSFYHFIWDDFCSWYIEAIKSVFYGNDENAIKETREVLGFVINNILKLIHPFMPFVSERIWADTTSCSEMLMETSWPNLKEFKFTDDKENVDWLFKFISQIRSTRSDLNVPAGSKITIKIKDITDNQKQLLTSAIALFKNMARVENLEFTDEMAGGCASKVYDNLVFMIPLEGLVDYNVEIERLSKEKVKLSDFVERTNAQLGNEAFTSKAPKHVIDGKYSAMEDAKVSLSKIDEILNILKDVK